MSNFKYIPYRNKRILQYAEGQMCQNISCGKKDGTVVACHSNMQVDGKGVGKKADDCFVAYLCSTCHDNYDQKRLDEHGKLKFSQDDFNRAMKRTIRLLLVDGVLT